MNSTIYDVFISGGGPAGTSAAIGLKDSGLEVLLAEKNSFPRDKICGDALSADVWNQLFQLGFEKAEIDSFEHKLPCYGARLISAKEQVIDFDSEVDRDAGYVYGPTRPRTFYVGFSFGLD